MASLSRKDIARMLDVSVDTVRKNEKHWGLRPCMVRFNMRLVRYRKPKVIELLVASGVLEGPDQ